MNIGESYYECRNDLLSVQYDWTAVDDTEQWVGSKTMYICTFCVSWRSDLQYSTDKHSKFCQYLRPMCWIELDWTAPPSGAVYSFLDLWLVPTSSSNILWWWMPCTTCNYGYITFCITVNCHIDELNVCQGWKGKLLTSFFGEFYWADEYSMAGCVNKSTKNPKTNTTFTVFFLWYNEMCFLLIKTIIKST